MTTAPTYAGRIDSERKAAATTALGVLLAVSASHLLNDTMQSLAPALYPVFRDRMALTFFQTGVITFVFQISASLLQPLIGLAADRRPMNFLLPTGMAFTLIGLVGLALAGTYPLLLASVAVIGIGSGSSTPRLRASPARRPEGGTASPRASSRSAAISASRPGRCSPPSSSCRSGRFPSSPSRRSPGSRFRS